MLFACTVPHGPQGPAQAKRRASTALEINLARMATPQDQGESSMQGAERRVKTYAVGRPGAGAAASRTRAARWLWAGLLIAAVPASARAQYPPPKVTELQERSGLIMRFA